MGSSPGSPTSSARSWRRFVAPTLVLLLAAALAVSLWTSNDDTASGTGEARSANGEVSVGDARMPLPFDPGQASVYLTIANDQSVDDALIGARAEGSAFVSLHRTDIDADGRATMSASANLEVAAKSTLALEPGGAHVMLDVPDDLAVGDTYTLTLLLESGIDVTVDVAVVDPSDVVR